MTSMKATFFTNNSTNMLIINLKKDKVNGMWKAEVNQEQSETVPGYADRLINGMLNHSRTDLIDSIKNLIDYQERQQQVN